MSPAANAAQEAIALLANRGHSSYCGEPVTQLEHALQAAWLAQQAGSAPALVAAALLHDIGHLLHDQGEDAASRGVDTRHEEDAYGWLLPRFGRAVAAPVRAHVDAKRYLCRVRAGYFAQLSPASKLSLELQGGPFSQEDADRFAQIPGSAEAVLLRLWDDEAKRPGLQVPELQTYRELLTQLAGACQ